MSGALARTEGPNIAASPPAARETPYPPAWRAWWVVAAMFCASIVSVIDRGILSLIVDPVRHDLSISEVQISLLQGLSFGLFYAVVGVPLGLSADRLSRCKLLIFGITCWSIATFAGGLAASFGELFIARLMVGLGEATLAPCAVSLIGDMFPPEKRGRPISIYLMGQAFAGGLAVMLTGYLLSAIPAGLLSGVGVLDGIAPWRVVFLLSGLLGLPVILMLLTFREPVRRGVVIGGDKVSFAQVLRYLGAHKRVFIPFYAGFAVLTLHVYGMGAWSATYLLRRFALTPLQVGSWQGSTAMVVGTLGALFAGFAVDRIAQSGLIGGKFLFLAAVAFLMLPTALIVFAPTPVSAIIVLASTSLLMPMIGTGMVATVQEMVPNNMRGIGVSLFGLFNTITGQTLGPFLIAILTENLFADRMMIGRSIAIVGVPALLIAVCLYLAAFVGFRSLYSESKEFMEVLSRR